MASGLEVFDALKNATSHLPAGSVFVLQRLDAHDLRKLKPSDLVSRGYDERVAERVSSALMQNNIGPLSDSLGLHLATSPIALQVLAQRPSRSEREEQLRQRMQTPRGCEEVQELFRSLYLPGVVPPIGSLVIQTILEHEYPHADA